MRLKSDSQSLAILGGTGSVGYGLALRWARAGYKIYIGSRQEQKAVEAVEKLKQQYPEANVRAYTNVSAAQLAELVVLTVPSAHQISTLETVKNYLSGKILVDVTVPLVPPKVGTVQLPEQGSAGQRAQEFLGESVMVVSAFQNISASLLVSDETIECDVLVAGNKRKAREQVIELAEAAGLRGWHAGPIANAAAAEALTSVLIQINRLHPITHSGIRVFGQAKH
ncbi:MAG: NADPH-dependent F420 reductase [Gammaproteobacteria bacterium]|nr:NADPH-dependent F420 reductase [Gammaproteobacteria bacterium]MYF53014.1 NADPH-dependent F420 reductase [Gammaproteobacteria bacterium]MYK44315.1 NADPH-dependent F420 reductase [Gammaproteobacteria bacterium]